MYRIGLLIDWVDSHYHYQIVQGTMSAGKKHGVNILIFCGGQINAKNVWEASRNIIYSLASEKSLDGIILASGSLALTIDKETYTRFCHQFEPIPIVSLHEKIDNCYSIVIDNDKGFGTLINHMIECHGSKHIGFIKGPGDSQDARQRYNTFCSVLEKNNIPVNPALIFEGDFLVPSGKKAVAELLEKRKIPCDVLIAANDNMAIGALIELKKRGIHVPGDIKVTGFDDLLAGKNINPSLSTVKQPMSLMGCTAVDVLVSVLEGNDESRISYIPAEPVIRDSCGCETSDYKFSIKTITEKKVVKSIVNEETENDKFTLEKQMFYAAEDKTRNSDISLHEKDFINSFLLCVKEPENKNYLQKMFEIIDNSLLFKDDAKGIDPLISILQKTLPSCLERKEDILYSMNLILIISRKITSAYEKDSIEQVENILGRFTWYRDIIYGVLDDPDIKNFTKIIAAQMVQTNIKSLYSVLYKQNKPTAGILPPESEVLFTWDAKNGTLDEFEKPFPTEAILPDNLFPKDRQYSLLIEPLYFKNLHFGTILFELDTQSNNYYVIRMSVYNALNTYIILKKLQETFEQLTKTQNELIQAEKMAALGRLVAGVAHEINTPIGITLTSSSFLEEITDTITSLYNTENLKKQDLEKYFSKAMESVRLMKSNMVRAAELVKGFKKVAVDNSSEGMRRFNVNDYIHDILLSLRPQLKKCNHIIDIDCPRELQIKSFPGTFYQILTNLIINSLNHGFEDLKKGNIKIVVNYKNKKCYFNYSDNGRGIDEENLKYIFDPFFTTKRKSGGTGLGLHIVYNLVTQKLNGTIRCESKKDEGVCFYMTIPLQE
ncbi:MAG: substrate-binding domain-containing protein [Spirochaetales bacterium]|nr:substrate-binding domain-containing protein [Spirochaetales bacterium]